MKKKMYALSGVFLIVLVISGLWATRAVSLMVPQQTIEQAATTLAPGMSMQEMTEGATSIVIGKCVGTRSQWIEGRRLVTLATVLVEEPIKGDAAAGTEMTVALPGGIDSKQMKFPVAVKYPGAPQLYQGEEAFLFLTGHKEVANGYAIMGYTQGKYSINKNDAGEEFVMRDLRKVDLQRGAGVGRGDVQSVPLLEFKKRVRSFLK